MANVGVTFDFAAESAKLRSEINKARKELGKLNATAKGIGDGFKLLGGAIVGALSIGAITSFLTKVNAIADGLNDLSGRLGASASGLQSLQVAAQLAGGSAEAMNVALAKMSTTVGDAAAGNKVAAAAFDRLGLSAKELAGLKADEAFRRIADATAAIPNSFERASAAQDIFGKGAKEIAGLLAEGGSAIDNVNTQLEAQGALLSNIDVAKIGVMNDELQFQSTVVDNLGVKFLSGLSPAIGVATGALSEVLGTLGGASEAGRGFGVIMVAAIKTVEAAVYGLIAVFEGLRSVVADALRIIAQILPGETASGIAQSLDAVAASAFANAKAASAAAIKAGADVFRAGQIFDEAEAAFSAKAAAASARATAAQGGFGNAGALAGGGAAAGAGAKDPKGPGLIRGLETTSLVLNDPLSQPEYLLQQSLGDALLTLRQEQAAAQLSVADQTTTGFLNSLLLSNDLQIQAEQFKNATLADSMSQLVGIAAQQGGALGKIGKAYAIAQTIWSTGTAVMRALAEVPYPANLAAAAGIAAKGVLQLANIRKTNIGGGGSVAGVGAGAGGGSSAFSDNVPATRSTESDQKSAVQIIVQGSLFAAQETVTWLAEAIGEAVNNRDLVFISGNSRQAMEFQGG